MIMAMLRVTKTMFMTTLRVRLSKAVIMTKLSVIKGGDHDNAKGYSDGDHKLRVIHAQNITNYIMSLANECIPNRMTRIRQREPQWLTTSY